jgi:microcystin degradation protein MlrC
MRVYVGGLFHESNAFSPVSTSLSDFRRVDPKDGAGTWEFGYSDFIQAVTDTHDTPVAGFYALAQPSAPCSAGTFRHLLGHLMADLGQVARPDAVLLFLHGAQAAEGHDDCAGDIVSAFRAALGPATPIGVVHDLHANLSPRTIAAATVVAACKEYPHTDFPETCRAVWDLLRSGRAATLVPAFHRVPAFQSASTLSGVMKEFVAALRRAEPAPGLISAFHGFPHADVPNGTAGILAYAETVAKAQALARDAARQFFEASLLAARSNPGLSVDHAVARAVAAAGTVVIADRSDNPGAGAAGDSTHLLRALAGHEDKRTAFVLCHDPEAVRAAQSAGVDGQITLSLGGRANALSGEPFTFSGRVAALRDDATQNVFGTTAALGDTALLVRGNLHIVVNTIRQQPFSPDILGQHGLDAATMDILVVKSTNHFYGKFAPIASEVIYCDAPGAGNEDLRQLPFRRIMRPVWPLDPVQTCRAALSGPAWAG